MKEEINITNQANNQTEKVIPFGLVMRRCQICKKEKPIDNFYKNYFKKYHKYYYKHICKECYGRIRKKWKIKQVPIETKRLKEKKYYHCIRKTNGNYKNYRRNYEKERTKGGIKNLTDRYIKQQLFIKGISSNIYSENFIDAKRAQLLLHRLTICGVKNEKQD